MSEIENIRRKFELLGPTMNEKMSRLWVACEAHVIGPDGVNIVAIATGISKTDIRTGLQELEQSELYPSLINPKRRPQQDRIRRPGGGRKLVETKDPSILTTIEQIIENEIAGDPMSEQKWMRSSTKLLSKRFREFGYQVSPPTVGRLLKKMGSSLKANKKRQIRNNVTV
jgi:hypothetical protein